MYSLQQTSDGGYIMGGTSRSRKSGDKSEDNHRYVNLADYWIIKLNADGSKAWDKTFGGNSSDQLEVVQQTNDGGYIIAGNSYSGKSGDKTEAHPGIWLIKLKADGSKVWDKTISGAVTSIIQTSDEGYILGGSSGGDYWIVKLQADGSKEWDKTL